MNIIAIFRAITQWLVEIPYRRFGTYNLSQNVGKELSLLAVQWLGRAQFSSTSRRKLQITQGDGF
jgi:hypothetical protein